MNAAISGITHQQASSELSSMTNGGDVMNQLVTTKYQIIFSKVATKRRELDKA